MESTIMNNMCRCCASEGAFKDIKTTYRWMGEDEVYGDMLKDCFDIALSATDSDGGICEVCITQLRNAANFKKQVLHTEEQFLKHEHKKFFKPSIVKVEMPVEDVLDCDGNLSEDDAFSGTECEISIKTETVEEPKSKKRSTAKASTSRTKKQKSSDGEDATTKNFVLESETECDSKAESTDSSNDTQEMNVSFHQRAFEIVYTCRHCKQEYRRKKHLEEHNRTSHADIYNTEKKLVPSYNISLEMYMTGVRCKYCKQKMTSINSLIEHLKDVHNEIVNNKKDVCIVINLKGGKPYIDFRSSVCTPDIHNQNKRL